MPLVIPNIESITNGSTGLDFQAVADNTDWAAQSASESGTFVVTGMTVTQDTGSDMKVAVAAGTYVINGVYYTYAGSGGTPITVAAADSTDRRDIVTINTSGTITVTKGTDCGTAGWTRSSTGLPPVKPAIPSNQCLLGEVGVTSSTTVITTAINVVDKTTLGGAGPGTLLARTQYAPSTAGSYTLVNITTGLTALDTTNLKVVFIAPPSGNVLVRQSAHCKGGAAVQAGIIFGVVSSTGSPGTLVGVTGLVYKSPIATAADDEQVCSMEQVITGLTAGTTYTWYFAAAGVSTMGTIIPQGGSANTTSATGAPAVIEVWAA